MAEVTLKNISKIYEGDVTAVRDLSLDIHDKEFLVLVGPSGCGKSTLLRMIAGLEDITRGELCIDGIRCNDKPPKDRDIAMVFQNYALYPHLSVEENLEFGLKLRKVPKDQIRKRVHEAAEMLNITPLLARKPKALSGGQRQRVALGRAIVRKPKVFLFDEPLSNLDAKMRVQMRVEISQLSAQLQTTMIYVTHDQTEAMTMGHRIVCMQDGIIQQMGPPLDLYRNPKNKFVAGFIGMPPMNFLPFQIVGGNLHITMAGDWGIPLEVLKSFYPSESLEKSLLGIRPENLHLHFDSGKGLPAIVTVVEPLGAETMVYIQLAEHTLIVRVPPDLAIKRGDKINVSADIQYLHFFDP